MITIREDLTFSSIRNIIPDEIIWQHIFPSFKSINKKFSVRKEKLPSSSIMRGYRGLIFRDWGDPFQDKSETWYTYIARTMYKGNVYSALKWANITFKLKLGFPSIIIPNKDNGLKTYKNDIIKNIETTIKVKRKPFDLKAIAYWNSFYIDIDKVKSKGIAQLSHYWINGKLYAVGDDLCFAYPLGVRNDTYRYKIYRPFSTLNKWRTNCNKEDVQNLHFLPKKGKLLIIQTSFKDILTIENFGYLSICANSENQWFTDVLWNKLKKNWEKILYFADNDYDKEINTGLINAKKYKSKYSIDFVTTPNGYSDISEYIHSLGISETRDFLKKTIK